MMEFKMTTGFSSIEVEVELEPAGLHACVRAAGRGRPAGHLQATVGALMGTFIGT